MHREGHVGIGMLWYAPIAYLLVDHGSLTAFGMGLVGVGFWSLAPDFDLVLPIRHRGPTHSIPMAITAGVLSAGAAVYLLLDGVVRPVVVAGISPYLAAAAFGFGIGFLGVIGHLVGDSITPMGIEPFWPLSRRNTSFHLVLAKDKRANQNLAKAGAFCCGLAVVVAEVGGGAFIP